MLPRRAAIRGPAPRTVSIRAKQSAGNESVWIEEGEFIIVPHGVEHRPNAKEEVHVVLFEPGTTLNTGNVKNEMTKEKLGRI